MKICVIGNSHAGSLKRGWDAVRSDYPDHTLTFFGARGNALRALVAGGNQLTANDRAVARSIAFTSGGLSTIVPADYDVVLLYGLGTRAYFMPPGAFYSRQSLEVALDAHTRNSVSSHVFAQLRRITQQRIYFGHNPLKGEPARHREPPTDYIEGLFVANEVHYRPRNAVLLSQPIETIVNGRATDYEFAIGSKRLAVGKKNDNEQHPEDDIKHMSDRFGALWLRAFFERLASRTEDTANAA